MMMPAPKRFDPRPAIAELEYDRTDMLRELHPGLHLVWDELDELRAGPEDPLRAVVQTLSQRMETLYRAEQMTRDEDDPLLVELHEMIAALDDALDNADLV